MSVNVFAARPNEKSARGAGAFFISPKQIPTARQRRSFAIYPFQSVLKNIDALPVSQTGERLVPCEGSCRMRRVYHPGIVLVFPVMLFVGAARIAG